MNTNLVAASSPLLKMGFLYISCQTVAYAGIGALVALAAAAPIATTAALFATYSATEFLIAPSFLVLVDRAGLARAMLFKTALQVAALSLFCFSLISFGVLTAPVSLAFGISFGAFLVVCRVSDFVVIKKEMASSGRSFNLPE